MNTIAKLAIAPLVVATFAGCATSPTPASTRGPYVKPGLIMLTADQAQRRGIEVGKAPPALPPLPSDVQALDATAVAAPTGIKVYTLNRATDPADPDVLHEQHVVYRRESSPRWRLDAPADQKILIGPRVTDGRQDLQPVLTKELTAYLSDQRRATEVNQKAITALFEAVDALNRQQQTLARREIAKASDSASDAEDRVGAEAE